MRNIFAALLTTTLLTGCQTANETLATEPGGTVTGATAGAIAGDMASRLAEQIGTSGATAIRIGTDDSDYAAALQAALKGWGYSVIADGNVGAARKSIEVAWSIDSHDGQVLARLSTPSITLGRVYAATSAGATPASPLSIMQRN